jgi:predicted enzyme related to lactoylglutathione lyase
MPTHEISSYVLRTLDPAAATAFYDAVLGHHGDAVYPLHEQARARGARPHWLGCVDTAEPEAAAASLLAHGGERLGPRPGGGVVLRDPGGAVLAVGPVAEPSVAGVVWRILRARDAAREAYARAFGWALGEPVELDQGVFRPFAWRQGAPSVGAVGGVSPEVHPQWLYFFGVSSLDAAVEAARARGATLLPIVAPPGGRRFVVGDDPQGAAFGLMER